MENKKIPVKRFVDGYKKQANDTLKEKYLNNNLKIEEYVSYNIKIALANKIVENSSYAMEPVIENGKTAKDKNGKMKYERSDHIKVNSNTRYVLFVYTVLKNYTNVELTENALEDFDMLNKEGLIDEIFKMIPEKELVEFNKVVQMSFDDFVFNNTEPHNFISNQIQRVLDTVGVMWKPIVDKFSVMNEEEIKESVGQIIQFVDKRM